LARRGDESESGDVAVSSDKKVLYRTEQSKKLILFLDAYNTGTHFALNLVVRLKFQ
jgi:hypothetical protein